MIVNVTEKHIADGVRLDCLRCPVALAMRDAFPQSKLTIDAWSLLVDNDRRETSKQIRMFMKDFDFRRNPQPFSFDFDALKPWGCVE